MYQGEQLNRISEDVTSQGLALRGDLRNQCPVRGKHSLIAPLRLPNSPFSVFRKKLFLVIFVIVPDVRVFAVCRSTRGAGGDGTLALHFLY